MHIIFTICFSFIKRAIFSIANLKLIYLNAFLHFPQLQIRISSIIRIRKRKSVNNLRHKVLTTKRMRLIIPMSILLDPSKHLPITIQLKNQPKIAILILWRIKASIKHCNFLNSVRREYIRVLLLFNIIGAGNIHM